MGIRLQAVATAPWVTRWGADDWTFNLPADAFEDDGAEDGSDESGLPGRGLVGAAMATWAAANPGCDVFRAACVFNLPFSLAEDIFDHGHLPSDLTDAVMVWSSCVGSDVLVDLAAIVFRTDISSILNAIELHHWMFVERLGSASCIGHEGL